VAGNQVEVILVVIPGKESNAQALLSQKCNIDYVSFHVSIYAYMHMQIHQILVGFHRKLSGMGLTGSMGYQLASLSSVTYL